MTSTFYLLLSAGWPRRGQGWTLNAMQEPWPPLLILWHPHQLALQMEVTHGLWLQISSTRFKKPYTLSSLISLSLPPLNHTHPPTEVSALKGEISPTQSVSMGTISRQVQKIALFVMKDIYTFSLTKVDMLLLCYPGSVSKALSLPTSCVLSFDHS